MPRAISVNKKYFPALSRVDSLLSSHLSGFGNRKPGGGGPEGVAYRRLLVEKAASELVVGTNGRTEPVSLVAGRLRTTSIVKGFVDAMIWLLAAVLLKRDLRGLGVLNLLEPKLMRSK